MVKNKKIIMEYSKSLTKSLIRNLNKSDRKTIYLQSDLIDLHYKKNNLNLTLCCKVSIDEKMYKYSYIADYISFYLDNFSLKIGDDQVSKNMLIRTKYPFLTKAQIKYMAFPNELQIKTNDGKYLYGMEDNYVTLLGDKKMYDHNLILESIDIMIYKTIKSKLRKVLNTIK
jgi:hypothetical protein